MFTVRKCLATTANGVWYYTGKCVQELRKYRFCPRLTISCTISYFPQSCQHCKIGRRVIPSLRRSSLPFSFIPVPFLPYLLSPSLIPFPPFTQWRLQGARVGAKGGHRFLWGGPPSPSLSLPLSLPYPSLFPFTPSSPPLSPSSFPLPSP